MRTDISSHAFTQGNERPDQRRFCGEREADHLLSGTFACPICGVDSPHDHTSAEIALRHVGKFSANPPASEDGAGLPPLNPLPEGGRISAVDWVVMERERQLREARAQLAQMAERAERLEATAHWVLADVKEWVEAVDGDSSWDGWDSHYKSFAYGGIAKAEAELAALRKEKF